MRLAEIQQPHPSQQPQQIVAHAQQGGEFGRAEKSHCYSHLKNLRCHLTFLWFLGIMCLCLHPDEFGKMCFFHQFPAAWGHFEE